MTYYPRYTTRMHCKECNTDIVYWIVMALFWCFNLDSTKFGHYKQLLNFIQLVGYAKTWNHFFFANLVWNIFLKYIYLDLVYLVGCVKTWTTFLVEIYFLNISINSFWTFSKMSNFCIKKNFRLQISLKFDNIGTILGYNDF